MKYIFLAALCGFLFWGCSTTKDIYYNTLAVTENPVGSKVGQIDQKKGGILEAAKNAGITKISTVSKQFTDTYTTHWWMIPLALLTTQVVQITRLTNRLEEIIVTGD